MLRTRKPFGLLLWLFVFVLVAPHAHAQVIAGIRANGVIVNKGDTVRICEGSAIQYQSAATGSMIINWTFTGSTIPSYTGIGPFSLSYPSAGYYITTQAVTGGNMYDSMSIVIQVSNTKPLSAFSFTPDNACGNINTLFTNTSTGNNLTYSWTFGDGATSTDVNPSHQFLDAIGASGTTSYPIKLVATNFFGCKDSVTHNITVKNVPDASVGNADPGTTYGTFNSIPTFKHCANIPSYEFSFINQSTTTSINASYTIQWGDGSADTTFATWPAATLIKHTFPLGGSTMTISVTGVSGCIGIKKYTVFLGSTPSGGLSSLGNTDICASDSLRFAINNTASNPPGTLYSFLFNDGTAAQVFQHPAPSVAAHYFLNGSCGNSASSGNNTFENAFGAYLTIQNPCGTTSPSVVPIYVSGKPRANMYVAPSETVCINTAVTIYSNSTYGAVITPTGGTGSTCTNSGKQVWTISPATGYTITSGTLGSLNGNSTNGLVWTTGTDKIGLTFTATGSYTVKLYIFNDRCGIDSTVKVICVRNPPQAFFTMDKKSSCGPGSAVFTNTSPANGCQGDKYSWKVTYSDPLGCNSTPNQLPYYQFKNADTSTAKSPEIQFNVPGQYIIRLTVTAIDAGLACPESYLEDTFFVRALPKAAINAIDPVCISNGLIPGATVTSCYSPGPIGYKWTFTDGTPATSTNAAPGTIAYTSTGNHAIQLVVTDSSCATSITLNSTVTVTDKPVANAGPDKTICSSDIVAVGTAAVNGVTYQWSPAYGISDVNAANPTVQPIYNGIANDTTVGYLLTASIGANCATEDSVYITIKRRPQVTLTASALAICVGNSTQLVTTGADSYTWSPTTSLNMLKPDTVIATPADTASYTVIGSIANGCTDTATLKIIVHPDAKAQFTATGTTKCAPVNLDSVITTIPFPQGNSSYNWYANGTAIGNNATGVFPSYPMAGMAQTVTVKLVTQSAFGCKADSVSMVFNTVPGVTASFTKDVAKGCSPLAVTFTNTSSQLNNIAFFWNMGNGASSTQTTPGTVTYAASPYFRDTTYYITLKAYNGCDTSYFRDSVTVYAIAKARFTVDSTKGCSPFSIHITNKSAGNNYAYYWNFGDGSTDTTTTNTSFVHVYHASAISTYDLRLIAQNQCGRDTQTISILVLPNSIDAQVTINGNQLQGCAPHATTFNNSSIGASILTWNFGDGTPSVVTPNSQNTVGHTFTTGGVFTVTIRLQNDCSDTTIYRQVTVYSKPTAGFTLANALVCTGSNVFTTNTAQNATAYEWYWGDGQTSSGVNDIHAYQTAGTYTISQVAKKLNTSGLVCTDTTTRIVTIADKIKAQINVPIGKACVPYTLQATAPNAGSAMQTEWTFYDSAQSPYLFKGTGTTGAHVYNKPGTYWVKVVVRTAADCADSTTYSFDVHSSPLVQQSPFDISTCNHDTTITFSAPVQYIGADQLQLKWLVNDQLVGINNPFSYRFRSSASGTDVTSFSVKVVAETQAGCGDTSSSGMVFIQPLPLPDISVSPSLVLQQPEYTFTFWDATTTNANKIYTWYMGDKTQQEKSGQRITYQYADTGAYNVQLYVHDYNTGCSGYDTVQVRILGVGGYLYVPNAICPGCANNSLRQFLPMGKGLAQYHLRIFNAFGQKVFETNKLDGNGSPSEPWDGRYNGQPLPQDTYGWQIEARYINGTEWKGMQYPNSSKAVKAGFITIVR